MNTKSKPQKPYPDFPLFPHASGIWAKKIRGKMYYFGPWTDWKSALEKYLREKDSLYLGVKPEATTTPTEGVTVKTLINRFLNAKRLQFESGELSRRSYADYVATATWFSSRIDKHRMANSLDPEDFERIRAKLAKTRAARSLGNEIGRIRAIFLYGYEAGLLERPMRFGPQFKKPSIRHVRADRQKLGSLAFTAEQIKALLAISKPPMTAMILLGINCGFGNTDVATVPISAFDLERNIVEFPRPKTSIERRAILWPETVTAIKAALAKRYKPKHADDEQLLFITKQKCRFVRMNEKGSLIDSVNLQFTKLLVELGYKRRGVAFYSLRRTFETVAGQTKDQPAIDRVMGHWDDSMAAIYRQWARDHEEDERLQSVANHVRNWVGFTRTQ